MHFVVPEKFTQGGSEAHPRAIRSLMLCGPDHTAPFALQVPGRGAFNYWQWGERGDNGLGRALMDVRAALRCQSKATTGNDGENNPSVEETVADVATSTT